MTAMKRPWNSFFIVCIFNLLIGGCATEKDAYIPTSSEELFGEWINPDYQDDSGRNEKMVFYPNGVLLQYIRAEHDVPKTIASILILDKWTDEKGNIFYRIRREFTTGGVQYPLVRVFDSGKYLEFDFTYETDKIDPTNEGMYRGVYKKK
jgi:hypothetical protein